MMAIQRQRLKALEAEKMAAIASRKMARAREITAELKSFYIFDGAEMIPEEELQAYLTSLIADIDARYMQLAS